MPEKVLKIYKDKNGKEPFIIWLESIKDINTRARIKNRVRRIEFGILGDVKSIGGGISELRLHFGPGYRIYFGEVGSIIILLLIGGSKNTQSKDIEKAKKYWKDYKNSNT